MNKIYERMMLSLIEAKKKGKLLPGPGSEKRGASDDESHPILPDIFKHMDLGSIRKELDDLGITTQLPVDKPKDEPKGKK